MLLFLRVMVDCKGAGFHRDVAGTALFLPGFSKARICQMEQHEHSVLVRGLRFSPKHPPTMTLARSSRNLLENLLASLRTRFLPFDAKLVENFFILEFSPYLKSIPDQ